MEGDAGRVPKREAWQTPRIAAVYRIPEVLGACKDGATVTGGGVGACQLGNVAKTRCSVGTMPNPTIAPNRKPVLPGPK